MKKIKKWKMLTADQKKVRIIVIISIMLGIGVQVTYLIDDIQKGLKFDLTLFGSSFLLGLGTAIGVFFAIVVALMQKEKPIL